MHLPRLAIVDLETTGADPNRDRITEIGILVTEGGQLVEQWSSLVNPGQPIPARIQEFTGISDEMVATAPAFAELADTVMAKLADAVFVAHNARFDYGFMRAAFERCGRAWHAPVLCTVKFSRALDPEHSRHGLDAIIARAGYHIEARHRALDDALIVWRFLGDALLRASEERLQAAWTKAYTQASMPRLPRGDLEALPDCPGAYVFRNPAGQIQQIGFARDLRSQVLGLFTSTRASAKNQRLAAAVHDVETYPCAGEFGAQVQELMLQRQLKDQPPTQAFAWHWTHAAHGGPALALVDIAGSDPMQWADYYGNFRGEREARVALQELAKRHRLCASHIGLEHGGGPCQAVHLGRCNGVCTGQENPAVHDARLASALASLRVKPWPFVGPVLLREAHEGSGHHQVHLLDHWCLLGSAQDEAELGELLMAAPARRFDADLARLLQRWFATAGRMKQASMLPRRSPPPSVSV